MCYICLEYGHVFEDPVRYQQPHFELDDCPQEVFTGCPFCGGEYEETTVCKKCGMIIGITQGKYGLCPWCEEDAEERFQKLLEENFTAEELEFLNVQYEGRYFGLE